jgi:hypothetical protein
MPVARNPGDTSLVDIVDRVLDQGIRFDTWPRLAPAEARSQPEGVRIIVEAVETHLKRPEESPGKTGTGA